jgi:hypothetical protein
MYTHQAPNVHREYIIRTYESIYLPTNLPTNLDTNVHTNIRTNIQTNIHTNIKEIEGKAQLAEFRSSAQPACDAGSNPARARRIRFVFRDKSRSHHRLNQYHSAVRTVSPSCKAKLGRITILCAVAGGGVGWASNSEPFPGEKIRGSVKEGDDARIGGRWQKAATLGSRRNWSPASIIKRGRSVRWKRRKILLLSIILERGWSVGSIKKHYGY